MAVCLRSDWRKGQQLRDFPGKPAAVTFPSHSGQIVGRGAEISIFLQPFPNLGVGAD
jgi:hypothetical protein